MGGSLGSLDVGAVGGSSAGGKGALSLADSTSVTVVGARGTLAGDSVVSVEAGALAGLGVADSLVGALLQGVGLVGSGGNSNPSIAGRAGPGGAVVSDPGGLAVGAGVASALVCGGGRG